MFPRLRTRLAPALLGRVDQLVELSTLGGYGIADDGRLMPLEAEHTPPAPGRLRDDCPYAGVSPLRQSRPWGCDGSARA
jgi:hypothetical protein